MSCPVHPGCGCDPAQACPVVRAECDRALAKPTAANTRRLTLVASPPVDTALLLSSGALEAPSRAPRSATVTFRMRVTRAVRALLINWRSPL